MPIGLGTALAVGATVVGAGATIYASSKASHAQTTAANTAANTETHVADQNNQLARDMYAENASRLDPYSNMGLAAGDEYMGLTLGHAPAGTGTSPNGWVTVPPTNSALAPFAPAPATGGTSALAPVGIQAQAQHAIAAGADPNMVAQRAAQYGVTL